MAFRAVRSLVMLEESRCVSLAHGAYKTFSASCEISNHVGLNILYKKLCPAIFCFIFVMSMSIDVQEHFKKERENAENMDKIIQSLLMKHYTEFGYFLAAVDNF